MFRLTVLVLALAVCLGASDPTCNFSQESRDEQRDPKGDNPRSKPSPTPKPTPRPSPTPDHRSNYLGCDFDAIDQVPDFLDLVHRFSNGFCAELDKAKIPKAKSPDDCLRAKREWDRLAKAYEASFVSKLSQQDQSGYILQMNAARDYLPQRPEMCSPEWIAEKFPDHG